MDAPNSIPPELLKLLACPVGECRGALSDKTTHLVCQKCGRRYPVADYGPVLIPEEALPPES